MSGRRRCNRRPDVLVRQEDHDDIGALDGLGDFLDLEAGLLGLRPRGTALAQADGDLAAGILEVLARERGPASRSQRW